MKTEQSFLNISLIKNIVRLAALDSSIEINPEQFDNDPYLLKTQNGIVDLRTGEHRTARPDDYVTLSAATEYDENAACPEFKAFLNRTFGENQHLITFVQRLAGYSIAGSTKEQILAICLGEGATGKSTFLNLLKDILGDYAGQIPIDTLRKKNRNQTNDLASLRSKRFLIDTEVPPGTLLDEPLMKKFTGGDSITARMLYKEYVEFKPTFKLWMAANEMPTIMDPTDAMWRRIIVIPFKYKITGNKIDQNLRDKLLAERSGILSWLVDGCIQWQKHGLKPPKSVGAATRRYERRARPLICFLRECCQKDENSSIGSTELYEAYRKYAKKHNLVPETHPKVSRFVEDRGIGSKHTNKGTVFLGLRMKS